MNQKQALTKARKLWGKTAMVEDKGKPTTTESGAVLSERYVVGRVMMGMFFSVEGDGPTWEEAFKKYEDRREYERQRIANLKKK